MEIEDLGEDLDEELDRTDRDPRSSTVDPFEFTPGETIERIPVLDRVGAERDQAGEP